MTFGTPADIIVKPFDVERPSTLINTDVGGLNGGKVFNGFTRTEVEMHKAGVMKTVYVPPHPYVEGVRYALAKRVGDTVAMYRSPHLKGQDHLHRIFFETYADWSKESLAIKLSDFPYQYPSSGSSEAIRESIAHYGNSERVKGRTPVIHVFEGEYEGYSAYAAAHGIEVVIHSRENYDASLDQYLQPGQPFYMSAPSGIDGNIWGGYEDFLQHIERQHPQAKIMLDAAYINTSENTPKIRTDSPVISALFMSLSKSFPGTYYDRIGGVFSKDPIPGLYGNQWFKSLSALLFGKTLMENSPLGAIPKEMRPFQLQIVTQLRKIVGDSLTPSDVTFIVTKPAHGNLLPFEKDLVRGGTVRYCITPALDKIFSSIASKAQS